LDKQHVSWIEHLGQNINQVKNLHKDCWIS